MPNKTVKSTGKSKARQGAGSAATRIAKAAASRRKPAGAKTGYINARVQPKLKKDAERVFEQIGVSTSEAVTVFLKQVVLRRGLPFPVNLPNSETISALEAAERGETTVHSGSTKTILQSLLTEDDV